MTKLNNTRSGCRDVFHAFLVKNATYDGVDEIPIIKKVNVVPKKLISFIEALKSKSYERFIHFYIDDFQFERIWNHTNKYLNLIKKFDGVILPDFCVYRDMPLVMQKWNIYRSRAIGNFLQSNGIKVIPNIRYGDERTYDIACAGVSKNSIIAIGTNGCIKDKIDRKFTDDGFEIVIQKLSPKVVIIYGGFGITKGFINAIALAATLVNSERISERLHIYSKNITEEKGYYDIVIHGKVDSCLFYHPDKDTNKREGNLKGWADISHRTISKYLKSKKDYKGEAIRLISYSTGKINNGVAQNLANKLNVTVKAPNDIIWIKPSGKIVIGKNSFSNTGHWRIYKPVKK
ncbi:MAG: DUF4417 domain-containing protein [Eubacteriales bacterium]|nr:DUF4417 domain-containing protein [Eubacteriales bacterium]